MLSLLQTIYLFVSAFSLDTDALFAEPPIGFLGAEGDPAYFSAFGLINAVHIQWYFNDQPLPGANSNIYSFHLSPETVGRYSLVRSNAAGAVTNNTFAAFRAVSDNPRPFRLVVDPKTLVPGNSNTYFWEFSTRDPQWAGISQGSVTILTFDGLYRWKTSPETIVQSVDPIPGIPNDARYFVASTVEEEGVIDFVVQWSSNDVQQQALVEKSPAGFRILAKTGDPLPGFPNTTIGKIGGPVRKAGKVAVKLLGGISDYSIVVYDGATAAIWADTTQPLAQTPTSIQFQELSIAFDGTNIAYSLRTSGGVFLTDASRNLRPMARTLDVLPETGSILWGAGPSIAMQNGRMAFRGMDLTNWYILEYVVAENRTHILCKAGDEVPGCGAVGPMEDWADDHYYQPWGIAYAADGSLLFGTRGPRYFDETDNEFSIAIYRWRNGTLSEEFGPFQRFFGERKRVTKLFSADGDDYVFKIFGDNVDNYQGGGLYTTLPGAPRHDSALQFERTNNGLRFTWDGSGRLQTSKDLANWREVLAHPGEVTNSLDSARFFRVCQP